MFRGGACCTQQELLRGGAAPDIGRTEGPLGWVGTESPLYSAAQLGHAEVVEALLSHRPRPDVNLGLTVTQNRRIAHCGGCFGERTLGDRTCLGTGGAVWLAA